MKKIFFLLFLFLANCFGFELEGKIAICSEGKDENSDVSNLAGRASYFQIYDFSRKLLEVLENPYKNEKSGAGVKMLKFLEEKNVKIIVGGKIGENMLENMKKKGIKGFEFKGKVKDA